MPRASKRKSDPAKSSSASPKLSHVDSIRNASKKSAYKNEETGDRLFHSYANRSSGVIDPEGIEALCSDIGVAHTDVKMLLLAWKLQAEKQGYFTLEEWRKGMKELQVDAVKKLKKALSELEKEVKKPEEFADFYPYAFRYCLTEERQKCIDIESTCLLLDLVLGSLFRPQIDSLIEYLKIQDDYKVITMDQWNGFLRFCNEITFPDLKNYDLFLAWPLIIDNFVEWMREKQGVVSA